MLQSILLIGFVLVSALCSSDDQWLPSFLGLHDTNFNSRNDDIDSNKLVMAFVVFRHGDRTPDQEELNKYPSANLNDSVFYPFGKKALTNKGKHRAFLLGEYLRKRYNDSISQLYLPNEISVRTTDYARTKMTALSVLAAMYIPTDVQKWNPELNWQPIPYDTMPEEEDNLLYFSNCPRYEQLKNSIYAVPEVRDRIRSYESLFKLLTAKTGANIEIPENVFFLDNLFQALNNSGVTLPKWIQAVMPKIKEMTKIEYSCSLYNNELIKLSAGVLMDEIVDSMKAAIAGDDEPTKLRLYSAHENNVAAMLAAVGVFEPHQPKYASAVSLELRKNLNTGKYAIMVVYAAEAGGPGVIYPIPGCGGKPLCDYDTFVSLSRDVLLSRSEYKKQCALN